MKTNGKRMMAAAEGGTDKASGGVLVKQKRSLIKAAWTPVLCALAMVVATATVLAACGSSPKTEPQLHPMARDFLDKGIAAEQQEQFGIALYWYWRAGAYSQEAKKRGNLMLARIRSGNIWDITAANSIQLQLEIEARWFALQEQTKAFLEEHNPFLEDILPFDFTFNVRERGSLSINRDSGTAIISEPFLYYSPSSTPNNDYADRDSIDMSFPNILGAMGIDLTFANAFLVQAELINGNGKVIATSPQPKDRFNAARRFTYGDLFITDAAHANRGFDLGDFKRIRVDRKGYKGYYAWGTYGFAWNDNQVHAPRIDVTFFDVPIADITDRGMTARITKVYIYGDKGNIGNSNLLLDQQSTTNDFNLVKIVEISKD